MRPVFYRDVGILQRKRSTLHHAAAAAAPVEKHVVIMLDTSGSMSESLVQQRFQPASPSVALGWFNGPPSWSETAVPPVDRLTAAFELADEVRAGATHAHSTKPASMTALFCSATVFSTSVWPLPRGRAQRAATHMDKWIESLAELINDTCRSPTHMPASGGHVERHLSVFLLTDGQHNGSEVSRSVRLVYRLMSECSDSRSQGPLPVAVTFATSAASLSAAVCDMCPW